MELRPGYRIDRYELIAPIAHGGMGAVWLARVKSLPEFSKFFAIKTVLPQFAADAAFRRMFLDETRIASAISHPNVASIVDVGEEGGMLFMVMEWVDGDSLQAMLRTLDSRGEPVPPGIALRVVTDACGGLHAVHEARDKSGSSLETVHRDVSPSNILIGAQGQAKLVDFGVARARDRIAETTSSGALKGKVRYMSPEQASGEPVDRRTDIWALGAVLYRLIEGRTPFTGDNDLSILKLLLAGKAPEPMRSNIPAPFISVIMKCLRPNRAERHATAEELQKALELAMRYTHMTTTTADVAAFVASSLREQTIARRATIEATLADLDSAEPSLPPHTPAPLAKGEGSSGGGREKPISRPALRTASGVGPAPARDPNDFHVELGEDTRDGALVESTAGREIDELLRPKRSGRYALAIGAAVAIVGAGGLGARFASRGGDAPHAANPVAVAVPIPVPVPATSASPPAEADVATSASAPPLAVPAADAAVTSKSPTPPSPSAAPPPRGKPGRSAAGARPTSDVFDDRK